MSAISWAARESATMFRRDVRHALQYPMMTVSGMLVPVIFLLLFAGVFGRTLTAGLHAARPGGPAYIDYLLPGILIMTAGFAAEGTAVNVCMDASEGIMDRFRTMAISRSAVLTGQVAGGLARTLASGAIVVVIAVAMGFRSPALPLAWLAVTGLFALLTLALTGLAVAFGLSARTPGGANGLALLPAILPFASSAFIPTRAMPAGVAWFAANEPFTPVINAVRGLLAGPVPGPGTGHSALLAVAWSAAIALAAHVWARVLYARGRGPAPG